MDEALSAMLAASGCLWRYGLFLGIIYPPTKTNMAGTGKSPFLIREYRIYIFKWLVFDCDVRC